MIRSTWILALVWTVLAVDPKHSINSTINITCTGFDIPVKFKATHEISLALISRPAKQEEAIDIRDSKRGCKFNSRNTICTFSGMVELLYVKCPSAMGNITLLAAKTEVLGQESSVKASFVEVDIKEFQSGIVSVKIAGGLQRIMQQILFSGRNPILEMFLMSNCVKKIAHFEDHFRIAVIHDLFDACVIGLRFPLTPNFTLYKSPTKLVSSEGKQSMVKLYIPKSHSKVLDLEMMDNYAIDLLVDSESIKEINELVMNVTFNPGRGSETYTLTNFEKGIVPFKAKIFHPKHAALVKITANANIFIELQLLSPIDNKILTLEEDEYLFTKLNYRLEFLLELDQFDNQEQDHNQVSIITQSPIPDKIKKLKTEYAECQQPQCNNPGPFKPTLPKLIPKCDNITELQCYIKVVLTNPDHMPPPQPLNIEEKMKNSAQIVDYAMRKNVSLLQDDFSNSQGDFIAILPYVPITHTNVSINKLYSGTLEKGVISWFLISQKTLQALQSDVIYVNYWGVKAYYSVDPRCTRIYCSRQIFTGSAIPKPKNDVLIILEGTHRVHYNMHITTLSSQFKLPNGGLQVSTLQAGNNIKYYAFDIDFEGQQDVQINCGSDTSRLSLYANIHSNTNPDRKKFSHSSANCQLYIPWKELQTSQQKKIYLSLMKEKGQEDQSTNLWILAKSTKSIIRTPFSVPARMTYRPKSQKSFALVVYQYAPAPYPSHAFKINIDNPEENKTLELTFKNQMRLNYLERRRKQQQQKHVNVDHVIQPQPKLTVTCQNVTNFILDNAKLQGLCFGTELNQACQIIITVRNNLENSTIIATSQIIQLEGPRRLIDGRFYEYETNRIERQNHFWMEITSLKKSINVYVRSSDVKVVLEVAFFAYDGELEMNSWPYPEIMLEIPAELKAMMPNKSYSPAFTQFLYVDSSDIQAFFKTQQNKQRQKNIRRVLLISVRDILINESAPPTKSSFKGQYSIIATSGSVQMRQDDQIQYYLGEQQQMTLTVNLFDFLKPKTTKQQIYLHNTRLSGEAKIEYYFLENGENVLNKTYVTDDLVMVNLEALKKRRASADRSSAELVFVISHIASNYLQAVSTVVSTESLYREVTLGIPTEFFIKKNSSLVFKFNDYYNENFKIKISRKQGFPEYSIHSCPRNQTDYNCIKSLTGARKGDSDPDNVVVAGRTHQLMVNHQSEHKCKDCNYFLAFYSRNEQISGILSIMQSKSASFLLQGQPMTTEVYFRESDIYEFVVPSGLKAIITVIPHTGALLASMLDVTESMFNPSHGVNFEIKNDTYEFEVDPDKQIRKKQLTLQPLENQNVLYTIFFSYENRKIKLMDGMPMNQTRQAHKAVVFQYQSASQSTLIIRSNSTIKVDITCPKSSEKVGPQKDLNTKRDHQQFPIVTEFASEDQPQTRQVLQKKLSNMQFSIVSNISTFNLNHNKCVKYQIRISNEESVHYTVLVNGQDYIMLPFAQAIPCRVNKGSTQYYEIPISEKTYLKVVLRMCKKGAAKVSFANDLNSLQQQEYISTFETGSDQDHYTNTHPATPGIFYIAIKSLNRDLQFTLQVYPVKSDKQTGGLVVHLSRRSISSTFLQSVTVTHESQPAKSIADRARHIMNFIVNSNLEFEYELEFSGLWIDDKENKYQVQYVIVESQSNDALKRFKRCRGMFQGQTLNQKEYVFQSIAKIVNTSLVSSRLKGEREDAKRMVFRAIHRTTLPYSYVTIVPIVTPHLPGYVSYDSYKITQLSGGSSVFTVVIRSFFNSLYRFVQSSTNFQSEGAIDILVILLLGVFAAGIYIFSCFLIACCLYGYRMHRYEMIRPGAPSEHELRGARHLSNSLDMLDRGQHEEEKEKTEDRLELPRGQLV